MNSEKLKLKFKRPEKNKREAQAPDVRLCAGLIVEWFRGHARDLPWRRDCSPYRTLVSEFMLQQTRVETVIPYFERWTARWPDLASLAGADEGEALRLWEGLGYYSRCRNLLRAARAMVEAGHKEPPASADELKAFPGIGEYTAGAVASVGYDLPVPAVDGNAERVVSRLFGIAEPAGSVQLKKKVTPLVSSMLEGVSPREFNQALMDLGATVCLPRGAACLSCPWERACIAHREHEGREDSLPLPRTRPAVLQEEAWGLVAFLRPERSGPLKIFLRRRPPEGLWASMWELPWFERKKNNFLEDFKVWRETADRKKFFNLDFDLNLKECPPLELGTVSFSFTCHRVRAWVVACGVVPAPSNNNFFSLDELEGLTLPAPSRKFLAAFRKQSGLFLPPCL